MKSVSKRILVLLPIAIALFVSQQNCGKAEPESEDKELAEFKREVVDNANGDGKDRTRVETVNTVETVTETVTVTPWGMPVFLTEDARPPAPTSTVGGTSIRCLVGFSYSGVSGHRGLVRAKEREFRAANKYDYGIPIGGDEHTQTIFGHLIQKGEILNRLIDDCKALAIAKFKLACLDKPWEIMYPIEGLKMSGKVRLSAPPPTGGLHGMKVFNYQGSDHFKLTFTENPTKKADHKLDPLLTCDEAGEAILVESFKRENVASN